MTSSESSVRVVDEWIKTEDGHDIFTKTWHPTGTQVIADVVMIHGYGEHIGRYDRLFSQFAQHGIRSYGFDQRGWGQTGKKSHQYGNNHGYNTALADINDAVNAKKESGIPLFLIGHSMGGGLILNYLARSDVYDGVAKVSGAIASAPLVTLTTPIPPLKYYPLKAMSKILPSFVVSSDIKADGLSHDKDEVQKYIDDPLVYDFVTLSTVSGFLDAGKDLLTIGKKIKTPILFAHGDADPVNSYASTAKVYEIVSSTDKKLNTYKGLYHELHNETEPDRQRVTEDYLAWIKARIPA